MVLGVSGLAGSSTYQDGELWSTAWRLMVALIIILPAVYYVTKVYSKRAVGSGRSLHLIDSIGLGPNKSVCLIEVGDRILVVGTTANQVSILTELTDPELVERLKGQALERDSGTFAKMFAAKLSELRGKGKEDRDL